MEKDNRGKVHFSIDDVGSCFRCLHNSNTKTIYEIPLFNRLNAWHEKYGICCSLYIFEPSDFFEVFRYFPEFRKDFAAAAHWLRFGYHGNKIQFAKDYAYVSGYSLFEYVCRELEVGTTDKIRLHNWYATREQKKFLRGKGIRTLLYPDDNCFRYDKDGCFMEAGLLHRRTDIRIECLQEITRTSLLIGQKREIEVFTHEGCFNTESEKIEGVIKLYVENQYEFI